MNKIANSSVDNSSLNFDANSVGDKARKGVSWSAMQVILKNIFTLGCTAILSRILAPDSFGLIGMVLTLTAFLQIISDLGLSWVTLQRTNLDRVQLSNLFIVNVLMGGSIWLICILLSSVIAEFYSRPELVDIIKIMGATFLLNAIAAQPLALLNRRMEYKKVSLIEITSLVFGILAAIISAFNGLGYWALVVQPLTEQLIRALLFFKASGFRVYKYKRALGTLALLSFGGVLTVNSLLIYFARTFDSILIGKYLGAEELGYYNRAYFLMLLPSTLITGVLANIMVPSLSAFKDNKERYEFAYQRAIITISIVGCPVALGLLLVSEEAIRLVYGDRWLSVVPVFAWLSIASITQPIYNTTGWIFTSLGKAKEYLLLTTFNAVVLGLSFYFSVQYGLITLAKSYGIIMGVALLIPSLWYSHIVANISFPKTIMQIFPIIPCLIIMSISVFCVENILSGYGLNWTVVMIIKILIGIISYTICCLIFFKDFCQENLISMVVRK